MFLTLRICAVIYYLFNFNNCVGRSSSLTKSKVINISQGPVRGYKLSNWDIYAYYGIPYATAPTGRNRYKPPLPPPVWNETLNAVDKDIKCPQYGNISEDLDVYENQQNCLTVNVYVPKTHKKNLSVSMYIYRGSFQSGYAGSVLPKHIVQTKRLIVVTINYRLGAEGFLCLGTENIPGNAGMKDQVAALKWIRKNIAYFGGNPDDITVEGSSAGARSADLFVVSKMARGLFAKVITESGGSFPDNSIQIDPISNAKQFAGLVDFHADTIEQLEEFYLSASYKTLATIDLSKRHSYIFKPCVERDIGQEMFLEDTPYNLMQSGDYYKVPMLYGFTAHEGIVRLHTFNNWRLQMNANIATAFPLDLQFPSIKEKDEVGQLVKQYYFDGKDVEKDSVLSYVDYYTDTSFAYPMIRAARLYAQTGNDQIYLYQYAFVSEESDKIEYTDVRGARHCSQADAVFDTENENSISTRYKTIKNIMRELWLNFINYGEPVPKNCSLLPWTPLSSNWSYMRLDDNMEMIPIHKQRAMFWDQIYDKYYKQPIPPKISLM